MNELTKAARDVLAERQRQITAEGYAPEHDDEHRNGEMGIAAVCYALHGTPSDSTFAVWGTPFAQHLWSFTGWPPQLFRPKGKRHNLKIAAALLLAEMERRDRIDDVIWVPCRGCTDLAGCEEHRACQTLDGWEVGINGLTEAETSATASVMGIVGTQAPGVGGPTYYVRHPDDTYSVADPQPTRGAEAASVDWLGLSLDMEAQAKRLDERPRYKLVPVEPTESMMHAGARSQGATVYYKEVLAIYRAMLDAAPAAADAKQVPRTAPAYRQIGWTIDTGSGRLFESNVTEEQRTRWQPVYITAVEASGEALPEGCEHGMRWDRQCGACAGVDRK